MEMIKLSLFLLALIYLIDSSNCSTLNDIEILQKWNSFNSISTNLSRFRWLNERTKFENFKANYLKVLSHNHQYTQNKTTFKTKLNDFSVLKHEDFLNILIRKIEPNKVNTSQHFSTKSHFLSHDFTNLPYAVDWRQHGIISPAKYQLDCGACWAFSSIGAIEALYKFHHGTFKYFSEQELIDCTRTGLNFNLGCDGGYPSNGFYHAYTTGVVEESVYPYTNGDRTCSLTGSYTPRVKIAGFGYSRVGDENDLKRVVAIYGPVTVAIDASDWAFTYYSNGIYESSTCTVDNLNHAILVVGYGSENGRDYWIIKNSWGPTWGENGFAKIARNRNSMCGITRLASFAYF